MQFKLWIEAKNNINTFIDELDEKQLIAFLISCIDTVYDNNNKWTKPQVDESLSVLKSCLNGEKILNSSIKSLIMKNNSVNISAMGAIDRLSGNERNLMHSALGVLNAATSALEALIYPFHPSKKVRSCYDYMISSVLYRNTDYQLQNYKKLKSAEIKKYNVQAMAGKMLQYGKQKEIDWRPIETTPEDYYAL